MKKKLRILVVFFVAIPLLVACSSAKEKTSKKEGDSYTIVNTRPWAGEGYKKGFVENSIKDSKIKINWDTYLYSDWGDKKAVVLSGGELPDAFWGGSLVDSDLAQNSEAFISLDEYITPEIMPNLSKALAEDEKLKAVATSADGKIYSLPARVPGRSVVGNQLFINHKWLDNLGLDMPKTYQELEDVLREFKNKDADGDGDSENEIPLSGIIYRMFLPWGLAETTSTIKYMSWDDKKVVYSPVTENYKVAIEHLAKLYKEGILDQEFFTQDNTILAAKKMDASQIGVTDGWVPGPYGTEEGEYVALPAIESPDGNAYVIQDVDDYIRNQFFVTTACKEPKKLLSWIDKFYTDDASVQNFFGSFGIGTTKNDDGTYQLLKPKDPATVQDENSWHISFRDYGPKYVGDNFNEKIHMLDDDGDGFKLKITKDLEPFAKPIYPSLAFTTEEQVRLSSLNTDIQSFVEEKMGEWVTNGGVDDEWDSYLAQLDKMGLDEFLTIQQDAMDRYFEK